MTYYLNFGDLNEEAQMDLIETAKDDLESGDGKAEMEEEADAMNIPYETLLNERAERHMYSFDFEFNI